MDAAIQKIIKEIDGGDHFEETHSFIPKAVAISHRRVMDYIEWAKDYFSVSGQTVIENQAPFLFTVSVMDLICIFRQGRTSV